MEKLEINHFKAFQSRIVLTPTNARKNLLVYGENGSGKSSLFEAIKLVFYREKLLKPHIPKGATPEVRQSALKTFYKTYNFRQPAGTPEVDFSLAFNGGDYKAFDASSYQCFMLSYANLRYEQNVIDDNKVVTVDTINLKEVLSGLYFPDFKLEDFVNQKSATLIANVNNSIKNDFAESFSISIENQNFDIRLIQNQIAESNGLHNIFNEAKINLTIILILLECVRILRANETTGIKKLLVIDDLITSLDASNRLYFANYLLTRFNDFQKIFLTHNVGFNNLIIERIKENKEKDDWILYNLYVTVQGPQIYDYDAMPKAKDIRRDFDSGLMLPATVGVEIRKCFEANINEVAKLFQLNATTKAMDIISTILTGSNKFYFRTYQNKLLDANNLATDIKNIVNGPDSDSDKVTKISTEIEKYKTDADVTKLVNFIKEFQFYERLFIHSLAHGTAPMPTFIQKEVYASTFVIEKIENLIKSIKETITTP